MKSSSKKVIAATRQGVSLLVLGCLFARVWLCAVPFTITSSAEAGARSSSSSTGKELSSG